MAAVTGVKVLPAARGVDLFESVNGNVYGFRDLAFVGSVLQSAAQPDVWLARRGREPFVVTGTRHSAIAHLVGGCPDCTCELGCCVHRCPDHECATTQTATAKETRS